LHGHGALFRRLSCGLRSRLSRRRRHRRRLRSRLLYGDSGRLRGGRRTLGRRGGLEGRRSRPLLLVEFLLEQLNSSFEFFHGRLFLRR